MSNVGPIKKFKTKKTMWNEIASNIQAICNATKTGLQCENRYKTVMKRKKAAIDNNSQSGAVRMDVPYEQEIAKIAALDDSIEPEILRSSSGLNILKNKDVPSTSSTLGIIQSGIKTKRDVGIMERDQTLVSPKTSRTKSIQDTMLEIHRQKEESRERRHREKLELIRDIFQRNNPD